MVKGLDHFGKHFAAHTNHYVLIGGAACMLAMDNAGLQFRPTEDLDIVLCVEALNFTFVKAFREFIKLGNYQNRQKSSGEKQFYRFQSPTDSSFPKMLELFSREIDGINLFDDDHLTPLRIDETIVSLSAILLDDACYNFIHDEKQKIQGISVVSAERLIPLKAYAWFDLVTKSKSERWVKKDDIKKHRKDVFRLVQLLSETIRVSLPSALKDSMQKLLMSFDADPINFKELGLRHVALHDIKDVLNQVYSL